MTDNEIIKGLECLKGYAVKCRECSYSVKFAFPKCQKEVAKDALDLINRKNSQLLKEQNKNSKLRNERNHLKAELEEKTKKLQEILPIVAELKAEAVKEFAERLKNKSKNRVSDIYGARVFIQDIDNLVKEMVGEG